MLCSEAEGVCLIQDSLTELIPLQADFEFSFPLVATSVQVILANPAI